MSKRNYWVLFVVVQIAGAALPLLAHSFKPLVYLGLLLLVPGDLLASLGGKLSPFFFYPAAFVINAAAWFFLRKILLPDTIPSS